MSTLGQYEVVGKLAVGGEGREVLLGKSPAGAPVAIKKIPRGVGRGSIARHPNLVSVLEIIQLDAELYRVMEYLDGETLSGLIRRLIKRREQISFGLAAHMIAEICDGLHAGHSAGELHRAVSPETIFITYGGEMKLLELGVALVDPESPYRSPEQAGQRPLGRQSDVYSIGLVLYELTTQHRAVSDPAALDEDIPPPSSQVPSYPPQLEAIVMQALAHDPAHRFRSAAELRDALLVASRQLDSVGDPTQSLASKLMRLFGDRIAQKRGLLDRVRAGLPLGDLVPTEADEEIEVPPVIREKRTVQDADLRAPELAQIARMQRAEALDDEELATGKPWSSAPVLQKLPPADSGILVAPKPPTLPPALQSARPTKTLPPEPLAASPDARPSVAHVGFRWGVLILFLLAVGAGGAVGAYLRLYR